MGYGSQTVRRARNRNQRAVLIITPFLLGIGTTLMVTPVEGKFLIIVVPGLIIEI